MIVNIHLARKRMSQNKWKWVVHTETWVTKMILKIQNRFWTSVQVKGVKIKNTNQMRRSLVKRVTKWMSFLLISSNILKTTKMKMKIKMKVIKMKMMTMKMMEKRKMKKTRKWERWKLSLIVLLVTM